MCCLSAGAGGTEPGPSLSLLSASHSRHQTWTQIITYYEAARGSTFRGFGSDRSSRCQIVCPSVCLSGTKLSRALNLLLSSILSKFFVLKNGVHFYRRHFLALSKLLEFQN